MYFIINKKRKRKKKKKIKKKEKKEEEEWKEEDYLFMASLILTLLGPCSIRASPGKLYTRA